MGSHSVTCHPTQVNTSRRNPSQTRCCSIYLPRRDGRLSWPMWPVTYIDGLPAQRRSGHQSKGATVCHIDTLWHPNLWVPCGTIPMWHHTGCRLLDKELAPQMVPNGACIYPAVRGRESNSQPVDHESDSLTYTTKSPFNKSRYNWGLTQWRSESDRSPYIHLRQGNSMSLAHIMHAMK